MFANQSGLSKTELSDLFLYGEDASEILSFTSGEIDMQISLEGNVSKGVYSLCSSKKYLTDYLLFAVNLEDTYINYPGIYAALTPDGIVFTVWTIYGRFSVIDTITDMADNESFVISFCWDSSGEKLGSGATMAIFVNDNCTASSNFMIDTPSMSDLKFYVLDSNNINFNTQCVLQNFACFSSLPENRLDLVKTLTNFRKSDIEFVLGNMKGYLLWLDFSKDPIVLSNAISTYISRYSMGVCDITGNLYFSTCFNDDFDSSYVSKLSTETSKITHVLRNLKSPVSISVIQKDAINYPRKVYYDLTTCDGVWIASRDKLIRTDNKPTLKLPGNFLYKDAFDYAIKKIDNLLLKP